MTIYRSLAGLAAVMLALAACSTSTTPIASAAPSLAPPSVAATSVAAVATPSPTPAPTPTLAPTPTPAPTPVPTPPKTDVIITAKSFAFTPTDVTAKAGKPFSIGFQNQDQAPHNVHIRTAAGAEVFRGLTVTGVTTVYQVPALKAGTYPFVCDVHPEMKGTLTVK